MENEHIKLITRGLDVVLGCPEEMTFGEVLSGSEVPCMPKVPSGCRGVRGGADTRALVCS